MLKLCEVKIMEQKKQKIISSEKTSNEFLEVNACGIEFISQKDRGSNRPNGRSDYHILYIEKGTCHLWLNDKWNEIQAGNIVLFRPFEPQRYFYIKDDNSISHYVHFTGIGCEHILKKLGIYDLAFFNMGQSASYVSISEQMVREFTMRKPMYKDWCASCLYQLLSLVGRKYVLRQCKIDTRSESRINAACRQIYESISAPPSVSELASKCCLSPSRFIHLFKEVTGLSFTGYIAFIRIEKAKEMLAFTDLSIYDISLALGYEDQNYFSRYFRKVEGCSPTEYRKNEKQSS